MGAYYGMSESEIDEMTIREYTFKMASKRLARQEKEYYIHLEAWQNNQVKATKKVGKDYKPYYKRFSDFYDYKTSYDRALYGDEYVKRREEEKRWEIVEANRRLNKVSEESHHLDDIDAQNRRIDEALKRKELK